MLQSSKHAVQTFCFQLLAFLLFYFFGIDTDTLLPSVFLVHVLRFLVHATLTNLLENSTLFHSFA